MGLPLRRICLVLEKVDYKAGKYAPVKRFAAIISPPAKSTGRHLKRR
jgi:hypothetical protein